MLPLELEDWITETGAAVVEKRMVDPESLSPEEQLIFEIWLLDTESRNGGLSQYFCSHGSSQWSSCMRAAERANLNTFRPFSELVKPFIYGIEDPYLAIVNAGDEAENLWYGHQAAVVGELYVLCKNMR